MKKILFALFCLPLIANAQTFPVNNLVVNGTSNFTGQGTFTLSPTGPTPVAGDASTKLATTQFLASPGPIGSGTANTGVFTTLNGATGTFTTINAGTGGFTNTTANSATITSLTVNNSNPSINYLRSATGAVARSYLSKMSDTVSILDFGADPTGVADSTSAIQSAITYVLSLPNGGSVYMPTGTYKVTAQITAPNAAGVSLKVYGDGAGTKIKYTGSASVNIFFLGSGTPTFGSFYDFESFGFLAPTGGTPTAIWADNINSSLFFNIDVIGNTNAIILQSCFNTRIIGADFNTQTQYGISTISGGTNSLLIESSVISNAAVAAINLTNTGNNIVIRDNDLEANAITFAMTGYTSVLFEGNYAENNTNAFFSFSGTNNAVDIRQNWLGANTTNTVIANITGGSFVNNTLFNNTFTYSNTFDIDSGGNVLTGTAALANTNFQTSLAFTNTWAASTHTPGYKKSTNGMVEIRGNMTAGASSNGNTAFNLPALYRPSQQKIFAVYNSTTGAVASCIVDTNGNVVPSGVASGNVLNLDGIMYNAGN